MRLREKEQGDDLMVPISFVSESSSPQLVLTRGSTSEIVNLMKSNTDILHNKFVQLGGLLGFVAEREVSESPLSYSVQGEYRPCIDVMWSLPLDSGKREAIAKATGQEIPQIPIVGIEIEASDPTTKTMMSDVTNIRILGAQFGILVIEENREQDLYRRASRLLRTMRRTLGGLTSVPFDTQWVDEMLSWEWDRRSTEVTSPEPKGARGGENTPWTKETRYYLTNLGRDAGFSVHNPYKSPFPDILFEAERNRRKYPMQEMWNPLKGDICKMDRSSKYMTESEIDMAWVLPLPAALKQFLEVLCGKDPTLEEHGIVHPKMWDSLVVVGFELDSHAGKHAGGGFLNLSTHCALGVTYAPDEITTERLRAALKTYSSALGLRNLFVRKAP